MAEKNLKGQCITTISVYSMTVCMAIRLPGKSASFYGGFCREENTSLYEGEDSLPPTQGRQVDRRVFIIVQTSWEVWQTLSCLLTLLLMAQTLAWVNDRAMIGQRFWRALSQTSHCFWIGLHWLFSQCIVNWMAA